MTKMPNPVEGAKDAAAKVPNPVEGAKDAADSVEARLARAMEGLVARDGFGRVLGLVAGNTAALVKKGSGAADKVVRGLRLAGRRDFVDLGRQLARTEDKLERVLQEVEALRSEGRRKDGVKGKKGSRA